jgi:hypothetical protein
MILNLTQHIGTEEQGVIEPKREDKARIQELLTFDRIEDTTSDAMFDKAQELAKIAKSYDRDGLDNRMGAMIGGALYFMTFLEMALAENGITPMYAFTKRVTEEVPDGNGGVKKTSVFKHGGWVIPQV